ncbi:MAG: dUTP diphosphatase [Bacillota bacterium]|nr:dUTP diphosphatase [Bacillota bacterium]
MNDVPVKIQLLPSYKGLPLPAYQTPGAAGFDFYAAEDIGIPAGKHAMIATGLKFAVPDGYELQVRPRSGLAAKHGVTVLNSPGTIDSDYRGEVKILLINLGQKDFQVERGMRIAQGIIAPYVKGDFAVTASLETTDRGEGGFGHTGL